MELKLMNLTKSYKGRRVVDDFSAQLVPGVYGLLGANGAGKTTLMRLICGLLKPSAGEILLDDIPVQKLGEGYLEKLGYLPQHFGYYPNFTGWEFMLYLAALKGLPKGIAEEQSGALMETMGLYDIRKKKLKTYSGGMLQRIGIAQALLGNPSILVLDEPTAGLDPKERIRFRELIMRIEEKKIILLSTHIVSDVENLADEVIIMKEGHPVYQGRQKDQLESLYMEYFKEARP